MNSKFLLLLLSSSYIQCQVYDDSQRGQVCDQTSTECEEACSCHNKSEPTVNTCDPDSFNFSCICGGNYRPPTSNTTFQAFYASCNINLANCRAASQGNIPQAQACDTKFNCLPTSNSSRACFNNNTSNNKSPTSATSKPTTTKPPSIYDSQANTLLAPLVTISLLFLTYLTC